MLPFNRDEFLNLLETYNLKIWPLQIIALIIGLIAVIFAFRKTQFSSKVILACLSLFWLWNGVVFCLLFWATIYKLAYIFATLCFLQGILFILALFRADFDIHYRPDLRSILGIIFIAYAMVGYQVFGYVLGHVYPQFFPFGMVPCPTVIFTFGLFLMTERKFPKFYLIIPIIVASGGFMVVPAGILEDIGLILAGIIGTFLVLKRTKQLST